MFIFSSYKVVYTKEQYNALRYFNYNFDQEGIYRRYLRESDNWHHHLKRSKDFIINNLPEGKVGKIAVLGSGWLLDVPVNELLEKCETLLLVDLFHPKEMVRQFAKNPRIKFVYTDITNGLILKLYRLIKLHKSKFILPDDILSGDNAFFPEADLYISVNILSQLSVFVSDLLKDKGYLSFGNINNLELSIQKSHFNKLGTRKSILITDMEEEYYSETGKLSGVKQLLKLQIDESLVSDRWKWDFETNGTYNEDYCTKMNVIAIKFGME